MRFLFDKQLTTDEFVKEYKHFFYEFSLTKKQKEQTSRYFNNLLSSGSEEWNHFMQQMEMHAGNLLNVLESRLEIRFDLSKFENLELYNFTFPVSVSFYNCTFIGKSDFAGCTFKKQTNFNTGIFEGATYFRNCTFEEGVHFQLATFHDNFKLLSSTINNRPINLEGVIFYNKSSFESTRINSNIQLSGCICVKSLPDFRGVNLESNVDLSGLMYNENNISEELSKVFNNPNMNVSYKAFHKNWHSSIYRTLKIISENNGDFFKKQDFFALELMARAKTGTKTFKLSCSLYEIISDYGRSFTRPLIWLLFIIYAMSSINHNYSKPIDNRHTESNIKNELLLATNNSLPLGLRFNKMTIERSYESLAINSPPNISYQCLVIIQIVISNILWFFCILAIRNNFRIK